MEMKEKILSLLPYKKPFHFVDEILEISPDKIVGTYRYKEDEYFYQGHFPGNPVTPGVILIETMAQIGLACMGIYLNEVDVPDSRTNFFFVSSDVNFRKMVKPGEKVTVISEKEYFRMWKLKCQVKMLNEKDEVVAKGILSGMLVKN